MSIQPSEIGHVRYQIDIQNNRGYIYTLFVNKNNRKQGIATHLLSAACTHMKECRCEKVEGLSKPWNQNILLSILNEQYGRFSCFFVFASISNAVVRLFPALEKNYTNLLIQLRRKSYDFRLDELGHCIFLSYLTYTNNSTFINWILKTCHLYSCIKHVTSNDAFYKQFGAKINIFTRTASFDLRQNIDLKNIFKKKFPSKL